jgi:hypothetical protein
MRGILILVGLLALIAVVLIYSGLLNVQMQSGQMPKVSVDGGQLPKVKAETGSIDITTENKTVEVPKVEVKKADGTPVDDK